jgi:hypothetical protein
MGDLRTGEAFVVIKVLGDVKTVSFQQFQGTESFVAQRQPDGVLLRVKPGRYYLRTVIPNQMTRPLPPNPEPSEPSRTVAVRAGMVNYIGDWKFTDDPKANEIRLDLEVKFDMSTVWTLARRSNLSKYGLMVSKLGELPVKRDMP